MRTKMMECSECILGTACERRCVFLRSMYEPGHVFFHQGDVPEAIHFVSKGLVLLTRYDSDGRELSKHLRPTGALLDAQAAVGRPHNSTAVSVTSVNLCVLPLARFQAWLGPRTSPLRAVLELALAEARSLENSATMARRPATERVAGFLLEHGGADDAPPLDLQHQLIAQLLDLRPETFSRALARLRQEGAIEGHRTVRVIDRGRLASLAAEAEE